VAPIAAAEAKFVLWNEIQATSAAGNLIAKERVPSSADPTRSDVLMVLLLVLDVKIEAED
jgi:hypothetical protein